MVQADLELITDPVNIRPEAGRRILLLLNEMNFVLD